eukprot:CAMPEP_0180103150 /NCGR_PEP_ID=MMETSP0985-20121206/30611_1 /TAXON_ID=483367 /ORGANISM="non described non described, Strain CCMP 2436" /LENGTH=99 /DNA_ID=CAMNT_0022039599 /DNA_START=808 /DNA_END=1104 /DNA_ORIENTATION=-
MCGNRAAAEWSKCRANGRFAGVTPASSSKRGWRAVVTSSQPTRDSSRSAAAYAACVSSLSRATRSRTTTALSSSYERPASLSIAVRSVASSAAAAALRM